MSHADAEAGFATRAIHAGQEFDPTTGAVVPPIYQTSTFVQDGIGGLRGGYEYGRSGNPTRTSLEVLLAALEGGDRGLAFASGLAAEDALLRSALTSGDHVVLGNDVYGGTHRLIDRVHGEWGIRHTAVDLGDLEELASRDPHVVRTPERLRSRRAVGRQSDRRDGGHGRLDGRRGVGGR